MGVCVSAVGAQWSRQFGFVVESVGWTLPWACASVRCGHNGVDNMDSLLNQLNRRLPWACASVLL